MICPKSCYRRLVQDDAVLRVETNQSVVEGKVMQRAEGNTVRSLIACSRMACWNNVRSLDKLHLHSAEGTSSGICGQHSTTEPHSQVSLCNFANDRAALYTCEMHCSFIDSRIFLRYLCQRIDIRITIREATKLLDLAAILNEVVWTERYRKLSASLVIWRETIHVCSLQGL